MDRSVIENLVVHHGLAHGWEASQLSDHDLAVLAYIVHRSCETGKAKDDSVKLLLSLIVITIVLVVVQPFINSGLSWLVQNTSALVGLAFVLLPCVILIVLSTFHK